MLKKGVREAIYYIYFAQGVATKRIKIGHSQWLPKEKRLKDIERGGSEDMEELYFFAGTLYDETFLKDLFKPYLVHGTEWFEPVQEIFDMIESIKKSMEIPS